MDWRTTEGKILISTSSSQYPMTHRAFHGWATGRVGGWEFGRLGVCGLGDRAVGAAAGDGRLAIGNQP
jgi:hypothetical protein